MISESKQWLIEHNYLAKTPKEQAARIRARTKGLREDCCSEDRDLVAKIIELESVNSWGELNE